MLILNIEYLEYPDTLYELRNDCPLVPVKLEISYNML